MTALLKAFLLLAPAFVVSLAAAQTPALPKPTRANVAYGLHERQVLDFYQAKSEHPAPLLFFIHGGGWMNGDKANPDLLARCLDSGISVVSINYRLLSDATAAGVYPPVQACLDDAARALQFVRRKAREWNLDGQRVCGCGGSAGGFNALWLAFHPDRADPRSTDPVAHESTRLQCALTFVPQTSLDPRQMREWIPNNQYGNHAFSLPSYQAFVDQREQLLSWIEDFSPCALVSADDPPVYLFYDTPLAPGQPAKDPPHSANFGGGLVEKLKRRSGVRVRLSRCRSGEASRPLRVRAGETEIDAEVKEAPRSNRAGEEITSPPRRVKTMDGGGTLAKSLA